MDIVVISIIGLLFGSFANVCVRRLPYGKSIIYPSSHCPKCLSLIRWKDNIPLVSFIILRGKCRICKHKISIEYPLVELLAGLYFVFAYIMFVNNYFNLAGFFITLILGMYLLIIAFIDINLRIIPDVLSVSLLCIGIISSFLNARINYSIISSIIGMLFGGLTMYIISAVGEKIYKKDVIGGGDIKLIAAGGSFVGSDIQYALLLSCFIGAFVGIIIVLFKKKKMTDFIPFGPYISLGIILVYLFPQVSEVFKSILMF
ncbi:MAG: Leader peptidase PppA [Elusimicrobia bacterium ADurb.Bin231]|nr:MAG: Leader peptidase PppA [Elusimicrobia bacterium ADurb.Bin231]